MGIFTDGMMNLVDEIHTSHKTRESDLNSLREDLFATMEKFRADHTEMAAQQKQQLCAFMTDLRTAVNSLKMECAEERKELQGDLRGAHAAWFGPKTPKKRK